KDASTELKGNAIRVDLAQGTSGIQRVEASGSATFGARTSTAGNHLAAGNIVVQFSENQPARIEAMKNVLLTSTGSGSKVELSGEGFLASFGKEGSTILENINVQTGARLKSVESGSSANELLAGQISLYFTGSNGNLKELDALGKVMWSFPATSASR